MGRRLLDVKPGEANEGAAAALQLDLFVIDCRLPFPRYRSPCRLTEPVSVFDEGFVGFLRSCWRLAMYPAARRAAAKEPEAPLSPS
jgi:hypothetical protein